MRSTYDFGSTNVKQEPYDIRPSSAIDEALNAKVSKRSTDGDYLIES